MIAHKISKWIEFNWLHKECKEIPLPEIVSENIRDCGGYYQPPKEEEVMVDGKFYDLKNGLIVINLCYENDMIYVLNTITHEWRHHWQHYNNMKYPTPQWSNMKGTYKERIVAYFNNSYREMDALLYSLKKAPDDTTLEWHEWLIKDREIKNV